VICPVLELREEKRTFVKVWGGKVDFFLSGIREMEWSSHRRCIGWSPLSLPPKAQGQLAQLAKKI
jgi:hypothetical protein